MLKPNNMMILLIHDSDKCSRFGKKRLLNAMNVNVNMIFLCETDRKKKSFASEIFSVSLFTLIAVYNICKPYIQMSSLNDRGVGQ